MLFLAINTLSVLTTISRGIVRRGGDTRTSKVCSQLSPSGLNIHRSILSIGKDKAASLYTRSSHERLSNKSADVQTIRTDIYDRGWQRWLRGPQGGLEREEGVRLSHNLECDFLETSAKNVEETFFNIVRLLWKTRIADDAARATADVARSAKPDKRFNALLCRLELG